MHDAPRRRRARTLPVLALALALVPHAGVAQSMLFVRVSGARGPIANATVDLEFDGAVLRRAGTDERGGASFTGLPAGTFTLKVEVLGYRSHVQEGVRVDPGQTKVLDVTLEESPVPLEGMTVHSERVQIQRENTEFGARIEQKAIALLPLTFQAANLVALTPGARPGHVWGGANFQADSYLLDGVSATNPGMGGDAIQPNINWIDKVEVRGLGAGAEYGGFQGGLIDITTKRGTNQLQGLFRTSLENQALDASNLLGPEIGTEVVGREDLEGEVRGPILRDRLFYYLSAKGVRQRSHALNHLRLFTDEYAPAVEDRKEAQLFAKVTWTPGAAHTVEASAAYLDTRADNYGITGYEAPGATHRYASPTWLLNGSWTETLGAWGVVEARVNHFERNEQYEPYQGTDVPGLQAYALWPPYTAYGNAPLYLRSAPRSTSASLSTSLRAHTGSLEHVLKVGVESTLGGFVNQRLRNGGMTWLPVNQPGLDPTDPSTWSHRSVSWVASQWGGEVRLDADVANTAAYAQSSLELGHRIVLSPGVRWNRWQGWLTPTDGARFQAVADQAVEPRVGLTVNLDADGTWVAKAHWGRYHQDLITQMFDRAAGSDVFTNEEVWYYHGDRFTDPATSFTEAQRDSLAALGLFTRESVVALNETGPVEDYHQPYVGEWLVGLEKQFGRSAKLELVYTRRTNHDMVALVDRNAATNYTVFENVRVYDASGQVLPFEGGSVYLKKLYVPNYVLLERMRCIATTDCPDALPVPGLTYADTVGLTWNPDYVLTDAPDATRRFGQFQFTVEVAQPTWGGSFSLVLTGLKGNLDNVSGYTDPLTYGPGPYVRVNEGVNAYGSLENFADAEGKVSVWGDLPWRLRGGAFWTYRGGDHYSPRFRLSALGIYRYKDSTGALVTNGGTSAAGREIDYRLLAPLEGNYVYVGPRGLPEMRERVNLDLHLERLFGVQGRQLSVSVDAFNVVGAKDITQVQTMVNNGRDYWPDLDWSSTPGDQFYDAALERVSPRVLRLGLTAYF
jgi:Carboxypeptidase regulatory-like domain